MHVLLVPSWYPRGASDPGGSFFREQAEILAAAGHTVSVLAAELTYPDPRRPAAARAALAGTLALQESREGALRVLRLRAPVPLPGIADQVTALLAQWAARVARRLLSGVDVVHAHSVHPAATVARAVAGALDVPWVLTEHRPSAVTALLPPRRERARDELLRAADALSAVSRGLAGAMEERHGLASGSVEVLPNPLSAVLVAQPAPEPADRQVPVTRFLHLSHLAPIKRVDRIVAAFRALRSDAPRELVIAGGSPERVRRLSVELDLPVLDGLPPRGRLAELAPGGAALVGSVAREDVPRAMATADRFVLASEQESFGLVLAESLLVGVPVIAVDAWGPRDVVGEDPRRGVLVPPEDAEALRRALEEALEDRATGEELPRPGLREDTLARYGPPAYVARAETLWRRSLAPDPRPGRTAP